MTVKYIDKKHIRISEDLAISKYFYATGVRIYINTSSERDAISVWVKYPTILDSIAIANRVIKTPR